ncbi:hypothetical protein CPB97_006680 [Podila verticillata]|nr:hypothetical protein CPB97_006680 [Podila verticillata]
MSISPRFSTYVASIICNTIISTTLICSILSPPAFPVSPDSSSGSTTGNCYPPSVSLSTDGVRSTSPTPCVPCHSHRLGHGSKTSSGSTLPLMVSYESISGPFRSKPKRKQASLIYFVDCWVRNDIMEKEGLDGNNDSQEPSSPLGDNTYLKSLFDQYPFLYRIQKLDMITLLQDQDHSQRTKNTNELHHPLFRHKKLLSFKGFASTSSSPLQQYSPGNKTRNKRKRTHHHTKNTSAMPPLYSQRRRYPPPRDIQPPTQRCCYHYPRQKDSGPYQDSQPNLLHSRVMSNTWRETRQSVLKTFRHIQYVLCHEGARADFDEDHTRHSPFRIKPHPKLESLASNLLVRSCLLIVLCMGAFWYCVTMMDQQQLGGSNWWADLGSETSAPSSITMASSSLGATNGSTSLGDTSTGRLSSPTPQETISAQGTRSEPIVQNEDSSLSFLGAGIITAFIRSTAAAMAEYSPLSASSNSGSASTTPILVRSNAFLSSFQGSRGSMVENGSQCLTHDEHEQAPKGRDGQHRMDPKLKDPEIRKENTDQSPMRPSRCFDRCGQHEYGCGVEMEIGESSRTSSRRSSIMKIEQDNSPTRPTLATSSPTDISLCPFQTHFYNMDALASVLYMLMSGIHAVRGQPGTPSDRPLQICSRRCNSTPRNGRRLHRVRRRPGSGSSRSLVVTPNGRNTSRRLRARAIRLK